MIYEKSHQHYIFSDDKSRLDIPAIHRFLSQESYWAENIPLDIVKTAIQHSHCFGIYTEDGAQIGFARVITDHATFGYLADVYILDNHRAKGLGKAFMQFLLDDEKLQGFRRILLATRDAQDFYTQFGFTALDRPERFMQRRSRDNYL